MTLRENKLADEVLYRAGSIGSAVRRGTRRFIQRRWEGLDEREVYDLDERMVQLLCERLVFYRDHTIADLHANMVPDEEYGQVSMNQALETLISLCEDILPNYFGPEEEDEARAREKTRELWRRWALVSEYFWY